MTKETNYKHDRINHSEFGGIIYNYDFYGYVAATDIAARIASDWKFDKLCRQKLYNKVKKGAANNV